MATVISIATPTPEMTKEGLRETQDIVSSPWYGVFLFFLYHSNDYMQVYYIHYE